MTSTEVAPGEHTGPNQKQSPTGSFFLAGEVSEVELGQEEAENMNERHVALALPTKHQPPCLQLPADPEAREPRNSFNLCIFSYTPKDTVAMGHIFQSNHCYRVYNMLLWYPV